MQITINQDDLYSMIKKAVKDVIREERIEFILHNTPFVSPEEMEDIEKLYGKPKKRKAVRSIKLNI